MVKEIQSGQRKNAKGEKNMAYTHKTRHTFYILLVTIALFSLLSIACDDTCIDRDSKTGICKETISDIGTLPKEIGESFKSDGSISPFAGNTGKGICASTGKNCD